MNFISRYIVLAKNEKYGLNKQYDTFLEADDVAKAMGANVMQLVYTFSESDSEIVSYHQED